MCLTPECCHRTRLVLATHVGCEALQARGGAVREAWITGESYREIAQELSGLVIFDLDIDVTEAFLLDADESVNWTQHPDIGAIITGIDGESLDAIGSLLYRGKGRPDPAKTLLTTALRLPS